MVVVVVVVVVVGVVVVAVGVVAVVDTAGGATDAAPPSRGEGFSFYVDKVRENGSR